MPSSTDTGSTDSNGLAWKGQANETILNFAAEVLKRVWARFCGTMALGYIRNAHAERFQRIYSNEFSCKRYEVNSEMSDKRL